MPHLATRPCPLCPRGGGSVSRARQLVYPCGHAFRACCVIRILRVSLDCPLCHDPASVIDLREAVRARV